MAGSIAYTMIFGKPLILYIGVITFFLLLLAASIAIMNKKGIQKIPFKWHPRIAILTICVAALHALLGILAYL